MKRISLAALLTFVLTFALMSTVQAQTPQETLSQYISDLQKNPSDTTLREKIIKHVQTMKPAPAIPEEAREHYVMAATFVEKAKDNSGYERAIEQYKAALLAAPWWMDAYKKLAVSQKAAAHYDDAIASLNLYILTQPADTRYAQDEIYKLKALKLSAGEDKKRQREEQQRAWESSPEGKFEALLRKIDGRRYACPWTSGTVGFNYIDVRGKVLVSGYTADNFGGGYREVTGESGRVEIRGRETTIPITQHASFQKVWGVEQTYIISEDGDRITIRGRFSDGDTRDYIYLWQR